MKGRNNSNQFAMAGKASLEALVFGEDSAVASEHKIDSLNDDEDRATKDAVVFKQLDEEDDEGFPLFYISKEPNQSHKTLDKTDGAVADDASDNIPSNAVWHDDDDIKIQPVDDKHKVRIRKMRLDDKKDEVSGSSLTKRLRVEFDKIVGQPSWANLGESQSNSHDDVIAEDVLSTSRDARKEALNIHRLDDANSKQVHRSGIRCLQFHPNSSILMTAGLDKTMNLYKIEGENSSKMQSVFFENFPIYSSNFISSGEEIILTSRRKFFHSYELVTGQINNIRLSGKLEKSLEHLVVSPFGEQMAFLGDGGNIHVVSTMSKRSLFSLKLNGQVKCACFSSNGETLYSAGGDGDVYVWNLKTRRCMHKFKDEGCLQATSLAINGGYIACGSSTGVVNIYDSEHLNSRNPKPIKTIMNLTTSVSGMQFNNQGDFLAMSSSCIRDSLKMFSMSEMRVCSTWPTRATPLGYVQSSAFSKDSGYFAIGNDKGRALLYRMGNYPMS